VCNVVCGGQGRVVGAVVVCVARRVVQVARVVAGSETRQTVQHAVWGGWVQFVYARSSVRQRLLSRPRGGVRRSGVAGARCRAPRGSRVV